MTRPRDTKPTYLGGFAAREAWRHVHERFSLGDRLHPAAALLGSWEDSTARWPELARGLRAAAACLFEEAHATGMALEAVRALRAAGVALLLSIDRERPRALALRYLWLWDVMEACQLLAEMLGQHTLAEHNALALRAGALTQRQRLEVVVCDACGTARHGQSAPCITCAALTGTPLVRDASGLRVAP